MKESPRKLNIIWNNSAKIHLVVSCMKEQATSPIAIDEPVLSVSTGFTLYSRLFGMSHPELKVHSPRVQSTEPGHELIQSDIALSSCFCSGSWHLLYFYVWLRCSWLAVSQQQQRNKRSAADAARFFVQLYFDSDEWLLRSASEARSFGYSFPSYSVFYKYT